MGIVKSVEHIELTMTGTTTSGSLTKGQVDANCVPFLTYRCENSHAARFNQLFVRADIYSGDLHLYRESSTGTIYTSVFVVEFDPTEVKVQSGTVATTIGTVTDSITSVDQTRAFLHFNNSCSGGTEPRYYLTRGRFTADDTIEFYRAAAGGTTLTMNWYVVEALNDQFTVDQSTFSRYGSYSAAYVYKFYDDLNEGKDTFFLISHAYSLAHNSPAIAYKRSYKKRDNELYIDCQSSFNGITDYYNVFRIRFNDNKVHIGQKVVTFDTTDVQEIVDVDLDIDIDYSIIIPNMSSDCSGRIEAGYASAAYGSAKFINTNSGIQFDRFNYSGTPGYFGYTYIDFEGIDTNFPSEEYMGEDYLIRSVNFIDCNIPDGYESQTIINSNVDLDNCIPFLSMHSYNDSHGGYFNRFMLNVGFVPLLREVRINRWSPSSDIYASLYLVEFNPNRVRIQKGGFHMMDDESETTINIDSVDLSKAFLIFSYEASAGSVRANTIMVKGEISSATSIYFNRGQHQSTYKSGYWWVVESLDDTFTVQTGQRTDNGTYRFENSFDLTKTMLFGSSSNNLNNTTDIRTYTVASYINYDGSFTSYRTYDYLDSYYRAYAVTFKDGIDVNIQRGYKYISYTDASTEVTLSRNTDPNRTIAHVSSTNAITPTYPATSQGECTTFTRTTVSGNLLTLERNTQKNTNLYCYWEVVEFPEPGKNSGYFSGVVKRRGKYVERDVIFYDRDNGHLIGSTTSIGGNFYFETTISGSHYIVCLDDVTSVPETYYNSLIYDNIVPAVI